MTAALADDVMGKIEEEINSITITDEDGTNGTVGYEPKAWTREGHVD